MKCNICGITELTSADINGCCEKCRSHKIIHSPETIINYGWVCPKCGGVYAPHISQCVACNSKIQMYITSTGYTYTVDKTQNDLNSNLR